MVGRRPRAKIRRKRRITLIVTSVIGALLLAPFAFVLTYRVVPPPITPLMVIRLFEGEGIKKDWVPLKKISSNVVRAVIALEDVNFCRHEGIDWGSFFEALSDHFKGQRLRGASTISMQTVKNVFLWPGRDYVRKGIEAPMTFLVEKVWDKKRIMEVYLNVIEWGPGIYGVEAASQAYFGKPASRLTRREAGLLAAVLPNPRRWSPKRPTAYIIRRMQISVARSGSLGSLSSCARSRSRRAELDGSPTSHAGLGAFSSP